MENLTPSKGYFSGPEGKVNATTWGVIAVALAVLIYVMGGQIGDYMVSAVDNTLHLVVVCAILLFILAALCDPKKRAWYLFRAIIRWLTSMFIEMDPIGIRKSYVERVQAKYSEFTKAVDTLRGQLISAQRKALENSQALTQETNLFHVAVQRSDTRQQVILSKDIQRKECLKKQYDNSITSLTKIQKVVIRYQEICADTITDLQADIKFREEQMALTKSTRGITSGIKAIMQGLPEKDMYDEAGDVIDNQYDQTLGAFDNVLDMTKGILTNADLSDDAALQAALSKFEGTDTGAIVGKTTKAEILKQISGPVAGPVAVSTATAGDYSDLLK